MTLTISISYTFRFSSLYFWRYLIASLWIATLERYALDFCFVGADAFVAAPVAMVVASRTTGVGGQRKRHVALHVKDGSAPTFFFTHCRAMSSENQAGAAAPEQLVTSVKNMSVKEKPEKKSKGGNVTTGPLEVRYNEALTTVRTAPRVLPVTY